MGQNSGVRQLVLGGTMAAALATPGVAQNGEAQIWARPPVDFRGTPGMVDMPTAHHGADADSTLSLGATSDGIYRAVFHFQIWPRLSGALRYSDIDGPTGETEDRSFDLRYLIAEEGRLRPAITIGLQDFLGTGVYSGEYVVATKTFGRLRATGGIGWGRFGSEGGFDNPLGALDERFETRPTGFSGRGGQIEADRFFRGDAALFGGVQYHATDQLVLSAEYSSDAYESELTRFGIETNSPFNFGATYRFDNGIDASLAWLYGERVGLQFTYNFNPKHPPGPASGREGQGPGVAPGLSAAALGWEGHYNRNTGHKTDQGSEAAARAALSAEGITLLALDIHGPTAKAHIRNDRYLEDAQAIGRSAQVLANTLPPSVETLTIIPQRDGLQPSAVTLQRADLEALQNDLEGAWKTYARARIEDGRQHILPRSAFPQLTYGLDFYAGPTESDPDNFLAEGGLRAQGQLMLARGLSLNAEVRQPLFVLRPEAVPDPATRKSPNYPAVRTNASLYEDDTDFELRQLTADYMFRPAPDLYGRLSAGIFEQMYGGVSAEVLWKPAQSRLGLGAEVTYARQRTPGEAFGFEDFDATTGFVSAYYDFGGGYLGQLDLGQYLAGDAGGTIALDREFDNGFRLGAYATLTDMPTDDFGEGSFDKGIRFSIPASWITGQPSKRTFDRTWRPNAGDGGVRVKQAARLYEQVRLGQAPELQEDWGNFWR